MAETAMAAALEGAGINRNENEFLAAIAKYWNNGGAVKRGEELYALAVKRLPGEGQKSVADVGHSIDANARQPHGDEAGQTGDVGDGQPPDSRPLSDTIAAIRASHRERCYAMEQRKRANLSLGCHLRNALGWSKALPEADRKRINAQALALIDIGESEHTYLQLEQARAERELTGMEKRKSARALLGFKVDEPAYEEHRHIILATLVGRDQWDKIEENAEKEMKALAEILPVWKDFGEGVKGFGPVSLAIIVAEAGDLSDYPRKGHLWKRMGVAVLDGIRQGGLRKSASAEDWIVHGYNRQRRSRMWNIGDALIKGNRDGTYRQAYLARKEYERQRAEANGLSVVPSAKIPAKRKDEFMSEGHVHRRAQRYMEKMLLRDLWAAWRGHDEHAERPVSVCPATEHKDAA